jgi:hypothetical protein
MDHFHIGYMFEFQCIYLRENTILTYLKYYILNEFVVYLGESPSWTSHKLES